jgi:hypothetical protein
LSDLVLAVRSGQIDFPQLSVPAGDCLGTDFLAQLRFFPPARRLSPDSPAQPLPVRFSSSSAESINQFLPSGALVHLARFLTSVSFACQSFSRVNLARLSQRVFLFFFALTRFCFTSLSRVSVLLRSHARRIAPGPIRFFFLLFIRAARFLIPLWRELKRCLPSCSVFPALYSSLFCLAENLPTTPKPSMTAARPNTGGLSLLAF